MIARNDPLIVELGNTWCRKLELTDQTKRNNRVSQKLREAARILQHLRKLSKVGQNVSDFLTPAEFDTVVKAVRAVSGELTTEGDTSNSECPSAAIKGGYSIKRLAEIKRARAIRASSPKETTDAENFLKLYELEWAEQISSRASKKLDQRKFNKVERLPKSSDIMIVSRYLDRELETWKEVAASPTAEAYSRLNTALLVRLILFNKRRPGEVEVLQ